MRDRRDGHLHEDAVRAEHLHGNRDYDLRGPQQLQRLRLLAERGRTDLHRYLAPLPNPSGGGKLTVSDGASLRNATLTK